jgi:hypothetical protein
MKRAEGRAAKPNGRAESAERAPSEAFHCCGGGGREAVPLAGRGKCPAGLTVTMAPRPKRRNSCLAATAETAERPFPPS